MSYLTPQDGVVRHMNLNMFSFEALRKAASAVFLDVESACPRCPPPPTAVKCVYNSSEWRHSVERRAVLFEIFFKYVDNSEMSLKTNVGCT